MGLGTNGQKIMRCFFPYTPATNLFYGLDEAINMLLEEGLENVFARHKRHAEATRLAVKLGDWKYYVKIYENIKTH